MSRTDWLAERRKGVGGSEVAALFGCSPWASEWDVWLSKTDPDVLSEDTDDAVKARGREWEAWVLSEAETFAKSHPVLGSRRWKFEPCATSMCGTLPVVRATPDALGVYGAERRPVVVFEAKTARTFDGWAEQPDEPVPLRELDHVIPMHYALQVTQELYVTGAEYAVVTVAGPGAYPFPTCRHYVVLPDRDLQNGVAARVVQWWHRHVVGGEAPSLDGSSAARAWLSKTYPGKPEKTETDADADTATTVRQLVRLRETIKTMKAKEAELENEVRAAFGEHYRLRLDDSTSATLSVAKPGTRFRGVKWVEKEHPELFEALAKADAWKETEGTRRLTLPKLNEGKTNE